MVSWASLAWGSTTFIVSLVFTLAFGFDAPVRLTVSLASTCASLELSFLGAAVAAPWESESYAFKHVSPVLQVPWC